jgi:hypothetical protein
MEIVEHTVTYKNANDEDETRIVYARKNASERELKRKWQKAGRTTIEPSGVVYDDNPQTANIYSFIKDKIDRVSPNNILNQDGFVSDVVKATTKLPFQVTKSLMALPEFVVDPFIDLANVGINKVTGTDSPTIPTFRGAREAIIQPENRGEQIVESTLDMGTGTAFAAKTIPNILRVGRDKLGRLIDDITRPRSTAIARSFGDDLGSQIVGGTTTAVAQQFLPENMNETLRNVLSLGLGVATGTGTKVAGDKSLKSPLDKNLLLNSKDYYNEVSNVTENLANQAREQYKNSGYKNIRIKNDKALQMLKDIRKQIKQDDNIVESDETTIGKAIKQIDDNIKKFSNEKNLLLTFDNLDALKDSFRTLSNKFGYNEKVSDAIAKIDSYFFDDTLVSSMNKETLKSAREIYQNRMFFENMSDIANDINQNTKSFDRQLLPSEFRKKLVQGVNRKFTGTSKLAKNNYKFLTTSQKELLKNLTEPTKKNKIIETASETLPTNLKGANLLAPILGAGAYASGLPEATALSLLPFIAGIGAKKLNERTIRQQLESGLGGLIPTDTVGLTPETSLLGLKPPQIIPPLRAPEDDREYDESKYIEELRLKLMNN